jgi:hypothetical protein
MYAGAAQCRMTGCVCKKGSQNVALSILCGNYYIAFTVEKVAQ